MPTTVWKIEQLERTILDGTVVVAHWRVTSTDEEFIASAYGTASFTRDPEAEGFIPYEELTEDVVLNWVWNSGIDKDAAEASLSTQLELLRNPVKVAGLPW